MKGPSASDLVQKTAPDLNKEMLTKLAATHAAVLAIKQRAETKEAYDQMIGPNNPEGNAVVQAAIDRLNAQTTTLERVVGSLKLKEIGRGTCRARVGQFV